MECQYRAPTGRQKSKELERHNKGVTISASIDMGEKLPHRREYDDWELAQGELNQIAIRLNKLGIFTLHVGIRHAHIWMRATSSQMPFLNMTFGFRQAEAFGPWTFFYKDRNTRCNAPGPDILDDMRRGVGMKEWSATTKH